LYHLFHLQLCAHYFHHLILRNRSSSCRFHLRHPFIAEGRLEDEPLPELQIDPDIAGSLFTHPGIIPIAEDDLPSAQIDPRLHGLAEVGVHPQFRPPNLVKENAPIDLAAPHVIDLHPGLLDKIELVKLKNSHRLINGERDLLLPDANPEGYIDLLSEYYPSEKEGIRGFINEIIGINEEVYTLFQNKKLNVLF